jgi:hypothetical protein
MVSERNVMCGCEPDLTDCCDYGNDLLSSAKGVEFLDQLKAVEEGFCFVEFVA